MGRPRLDPREVARRISRLFRGRTSAADVIEEKCRSWDSPEAASTYAAATNAGDPLFQTVVAPLFRSYLDPGASVLDVGCGTGRLTFSLVDHGCRLTGCDISEHMLAELNRAKGDRHIDLRLTDGTRLPAADGEFDAVVSMDYLLHWPDWPQRLGEKARCCRQGGRIVFNFLSREHVDLAAQVGRRPYQLYSSTIGGDSVPFAATATCGELRSCAADLGLRLVAVHPYNLLFANWWIAAGLHAEAHARYESELADQLKCDDVVAFVGWLEKRLVQNLPPGATYYQIIALERL
jgi:SAM-dependent methyltransferase